MASYHMEWRNMKFMICDITVGKDEYKNLFIRDVDREKMGFFTYRDGGKGKELNFFGRPTIVKMRRRLTVEEAYKILKSRKEGVNEEFWKHLLEKHGYKTAIELDGSEFAEIKALTGDNGAY